LGNRFAIASTDSTKDLSAMKRLLAIFLVLLTFASVLLVFIPAFLIRPFVAQSYSGLLISFTLRNLNPSLTLWLAAASILPVIYLWRKTSSLRGKSFVAVAAALLLAAAILARQNHFEWIFRPAPPANFMEASRSTHVGNKDMVLTVQMGHESRAYPVRILAYHHLLNDSVGDEPIVVTY
jgi:hypothetical protein